MHKLGGLLLIFLLVVGVYAEDTKEPQLPEAPPKKKSVEYRPETVLPEPKLPEAPAKKKSVEYRPGIDLPDVRLPDAPPKKESPAYQPDLNLLRLQLPEVKTGQGILNLSDFSGGLNLKAFPTQLKNNEAQSLQNAWWDKFGALGRRKGYTHFSIDDSAMGINGLFRFYRQSDTAYLMVGGDTALYYAQNDSTVFNKIKSDIPTGGDFDFTTYKDQVVCSYPNVLTFGFNGHTTWNLGVVDTVNIDSIYTSACTTIYKARASKGWTTDEWVGYLWYNPLSENPYELICKNTDRRVYTHTDQNLIQNYDIEMDSQTATLPRHWEKDGDGTFFKYYGSPDSGNYSAQIKDGVDGAWTYGKQLIKNVQDSTTYNVQLGCRCVATISNAHLQIRSGDLSETLLTKDLQITCDGGWNTITGDTFYTGAFDSVWVYIGNEDDADSLHFDNVHIRRKNYRYPTGNFYIYNWFNVGSNVETGTLDSFQLDGCREYLYGISGTNWDNHFIKITSDNAKNSTGLIKTINNYSYVEPALEPDILDGETPTYEIYPQTFWQSHYNTVFRNRLVLAKDSLNSNLIYYSDINEFNFPSTNFFTTHTPDGDKITGLANLYNDQSGVRASSDDKLVILKTNNLLGCDGDFIPYIIATGIGAVSQKSIVNAEGLFVGFAHTSGYYATDGNKVFQPALSEPIKPFWDNINKSAMNTITAGYYDRHLLISVPYDTFTYPCTTLIYNIDNKSWSGANISASVFANQWGLDDTIKFLWGRPDSGFICRYGVSNFDDGDTITLTFKSKEFDIDLMQQERFVQLYLSYDQTTTNLTTLNFYKDFGTTPTWTKTLSGTGKTVDKVFISPDIYGKTLSWGLESKDPDITIGDVNIRFNLMGGY